ncbi:MAG: hypothetical protein PHD76_02560 [Methylacidiphilales bacterium]|nr:hypothetical protein [Candidatus Methylacidiphilales bacterium]
MNRIPEPNLPASRASLPVGCSDLIDAYKIRIASKQERSHFLFKISALLHDPVLCQLDRELLLTRDPDLLKPRISEILHPILLPNPQLQEQIGSSADLVNSIFDVVMANLHEEKN